MQKPYLHYLGHLVALSQSVHHYEENFEMLERVWGLHPSDELVGDVIDRLLTEANTGLEHASRNVGRIAEHEIHVSAGEVEMWIQAVEITLQNFYDEFQLDNIMGSWIHAHFHAVTVIAQASRLIELIRTSPNLISQLGGRRKTSDNINRGWTLLSRLYKAMRPYLADGLLDNNYKGLIEFFEELDECTDAATKEDLTRLVFTGYVPTGHGLPVGGVGFNIILHQCAQGEAPDQSTKGPTSGWSIGRHGNKENLGSGRL